MTNYIVTFCVVPTHGVLGNNFRIKGVFMTKFICIVLSLLVLAGSAFAQGPQAQTTASATTTGPQQRTISFLYHRDLLPIEEETEKFLQGVVRKGTFNSANVAYAPAAGQTDRQVYIYGKWNLEGWGHYYDLKAIYKNTLADFLNRKFKIVRRIGAANALYDDPNVWYAPLSAASQTFFAQGLVDSENLRSGYYPSEAIKAKGVSGDQYLVIRDDNSYGPERFTLLRIDGNKTAHIAAGLIYSQDDAIKFALWDQMARAIANPVPYLQAAP